MGNQQTRESRAPGAAEFTGTSATPAQNRPSRHAGGSTNTNPARPDRRNRLSRADVFGAFINNSAAGGAHGQDQSPGSSGRLHEGAEDEPFQRKETRQERDARRREKHAALRLAEREQSLRTEGVDGGYLVTLGTYTGPEDFSKSVVRQLQIERRLAPFWRGLENHEEGWTDYQLAAAVRGLDVPDSDEQPPEGFFAPLVIPFPTRQDAPGQSASLSVPGAGASDHGQASALSSPPSPAPRASSPFRPRGARALAVALNLGGQKSHSSEVTVAPPREITLPQDTNIDGRPIESVLYRDATECPICFLTYPPYLNHTRCCSQPICSECFVQIKRPDPHLPEHHPGEDAPPAGVPDEEREEELISEPSTCPYCQQSELGVTYEPPPFRRGLVYSSPLGDALLSPAASQAMSSQSSLNSPPNPASPTTGTRRRTHSLSANAPNVVTTDRIRPDWETKLMTARQNRARRAAAATALHTAAFMTHQPAGWGRLALFRHAVSAGSSSAPRQPLSLGDEAGASSNENNDPATQAYSRLEDFENFLVAEGIRQSLASKESEDRKEAKRREKEERKAREKTEKEERKAREQREKEERKALKQHQKSVYGGGSGSASRSSLSLPFGRKRGNSAASLMKGNNPAQSALSTPGEADEEEPQPQGHSQSQSVDKGKAPERPASHLRHFSTASSMQSRQQGSWAGSVDGAGNTSPGSQEHGRPAQSSAGARESALSLDSTADSEGAQAGTEATDPLFNYRTFAEGMGMNIDTGRIEDTPATLVSEAAQAQGARQEGEDVDVSVATLRPGGSSEVSQSDTQVDSQAQAPSKLEAPELVVTPDTPADGPGETGDKFSLGATSHVVESREVTQ